MKKPIETCESVSENSPSLVDLKRALKKHSTVELIDSKAIASFYALIYFNISSMNQDMPWASKIPKSRSDAADITPNLGLSNRLGFLGFRLAWPVNWLNGAVPNHSVDHSKQGFVCVVSFRQWFEDVSCKVHHPKSTNIQLPPASEGHVKAKYHRTRSSYAICKRYSYWFGPGGP